MSSEPDRFGSQPDGPAYLADTSPKPAPRPSADPEPAAVAEPESASLSQTAKTWVVVIGALLVVWFFIAWLALDRHVLDAAGESVGTAFALLIVVSVIGAVRGSK